MRGPDGARRPRSEPRAGRAELALPLAPAAQAPGAAGQARRDPW